MTDRGVARSLPVVRTVFQISLSPPPPRPTTPNLTDRSTHIDVIILCLQRRQAWVKITCSRFIPSRLLSPFKIQTKTDFLIWRKSLLFGNKLFSVSKKQTVRYFRKNTSKNQTELNAIEAIYIVVVVLLISTLSFLIILFFDFYYFILLFLPSNFQVRTCVPCVQVATPLTDVTIKTMGQNSNGKVYKLSQGC